MPDENLKNDKKVRVREEGSNPSEVQEEPALQIPKKGSEPLWKQLKSPIIWVPLLVTVLITLADTIYKEHRIDARHWGEKVIVVKKLKKEIDSRATKTKGYLENLDLKQARESDGTLKLEVATFELLVQATGQANNYLRINLFPEYAGENMVSLLSQLKLRSEPNMEKILDDAVASTWELQRIQETLNDATTKAAAKASEASEIADKAAAKAAAKVTDTKAAATKAATEAATKATADTAAAKAAAKVANAADVAKATNAAAKAVAKATAVIAAAAKTAADKAVSDKAAAITAVKAKAEVIAKAAADTAATIATANTAAIAAIIAASIGTADTAHTAETASTKSIPLFYASAAAFSAKITSENASKTASIATEAATKAAATKAVAKAAAAKAAEKATAEKAAAAAAADKAAAADAAADKAVADKATADDNATIAAIKAATANAVANAAAKVVADSPIDRTNLVASSNNSGTIILKVVEGAAKQLNNLTAVTGKPYLTGVGALTKKVGAWCPAEAALDTLAYSSPLCLPSQ